MDWQEYQSAVSELYAQAEGIGVVRRNITLPDRITGQPRQVDCWIDCHIKGHKLGILIDAKYRKYKINVNQIDDVWALAKAVGADKAIVVCSNGWTNPAETKAKSLGMDLRLWTAEDAAVFMNPDFWMFCPVCDTGLIIMDNEGAIELIDRSILWWLAGQCTECRGGVIWCQACGQQLAAPYGKTRWCFCGHMWRFGKQGLSLYIKHKRKVTRIL
jgi:hypothetical protein